MVKKKTNNIIYIDMDDVIADFYTAATNNPYKIVDEVLMWDKDFFLNLKPTRGSQYYVRLLEQMGFDLYILTQPLAGHPESYSAKAEWIQRYFPQLYNKIIMTSNKGLMNGAFLIDDNLKWKEPFEKNGGTFLHFHYGAYNTDDSTEPRFIWKNIIEQIKLKNI